MPDLNDLANYMYSLLPDPGMRLANRKAQVAALEVVEELARVTPADTGTAISNWQVTLDQPADTVIPAYAPSPKGFKKNGVWVHAVPSSVTAAANFQPVSDAAITVLLTKQPGQPVFIANNVEYINELDMGSSTQAPAGFVARSQLIVAAVVKSQSVRVF